MINNVEKTRSVRKKEAILNATEALILQYGTEKTSIRDIAKRANVSQVTIYNHFGDKEVLLSEVTERIINKCLSDYEKIINGSDDFEEKLRCIFDIRVNINSRGLWLALTKIAQEDPFIQERMEQVYYHRQKKAFLTLVQQGKSEGVVNRELSDEAILIYMEMFKDYYMKAENAKLFTGGSILIKELWLLFWSGISGKFE